MKYPRKVFFAQSQYLKTAILTLVCILCSIYSCKVMAQNEQKKDTEVIHLSDFQRHNLNNNTVYPWYLPAYQAYTPDISVLRPLYSIKKSITVTIYGGSWCDDTHALLPVFYKVADAISMDSSSIKLIGVDRDKKAAHGEEKDMNITKVPSFIFYYDGKEVGRIVESVQKTMEQDMAAIYKPYY
jgi:thiol-disulfide isomerase/thioredoxin